jgi:hypothetical protein
MIGLRSKILLGCVSVAPFSMEVIWFFEFRALREIQQRQMSVDQALQYQLAFYPSWLPKLMYLVIFGILCTVPALISLYFDNRRKRLSP